MEIKAIESKSKIDAEVKIPGSKSYTNRALICVTLAEGESVLENVSFCEDTEAMKKGLMELGTDIDCEDDKFFVEGSPENLHPADDDIYVGAAGTTMRFLTGFCTLIPGSHKLVGTERMHQRPIEDLVDALKQLIDGEISTESTNREGKGCPPVKIVTRGLKGGDVRIRVDSSSQYLSSLLMVSPYAREDVLVIPIGQFVEKPYIDMTLETMGDFQVKVEENGKYLIRINQRYRPTIYHIESDASNASYFMAAAAITGGKISVGEFRKYSRQGDLGFIDILENMGCAVRRKFPYIEIHGTGELQGIDIDMGAMPDAVPTLAVLAAVAKGKTTIRGIRNLKIKETDRLNALEQELNKANIKTYFTEDGLTIYGGNPSAAEIETYNDHRMAMSFSVLGLRVPGIKIKNPSCVSKSFPTFYELLDRL